MDICTPIDDEIIKKLHIGQRITISGYIYTGRDAVLPKLKYEIENGNLDIDLQGSVIFHTAVSTAGVGPTSSNKLEIEGSFEALSYSGVKIHLGKGRIGEDTIKKLEEHNSVYAVIPPVTALLQSKILEKSIVKYENEGMEAMHRLKVEKIPIIIAAAHGKSIY